MKKPPILIMLFLFSFSNFLGLMYSAALPELTLYFKVEKAVAQQTIVLFLLGFSLGQLIYAPLSSGIGRKKAIYFGCCLAFFGSFICVLSIELKYFFLLLLGRLITALGSSCSLSMTFIMISDVFSQEEAKKKISILIGGFAFFPALGILIGGILTDYLSWKDCFYFMLLYSVFILTLCTFLPETLKKERREKIHPLHALKTYLEHFKYPIFLLCALIMGVAGGVIYIFAAEAPYIAINQLKISPNLFGVLNLIPFVGLFLGGIFSSRLSSKFSPKSLILSGASVYVISSLFMLASFLEKYVNINTLFFFPFAMFFSFPLLFSNSSLLGISESPHRAYASSLINFLQILVAALIMEISFFFREEKATTLPSIYLAIGITLVLLWIILKSLSRTKNP